MSDKVFCKYCKYERDGMNSEFSETNCAYPDNVVEQKEINQDNFYQPHSLHRTKYRNIANNLNKNNDCKWYKHSFWKIF